MKDNPTKGHVPPAKGPGLHNDFSEQEETMTASAMPPTFALDASGAATNPGAAKEGEAKAEKKATIQVDGVPNELVLTLEKWEGISYKSYRDNGHVSGGMGHLLGTKEEQDKYPVGTAIPKAVVEAWARKDVGEAWAAAKSQAAELGVDSHDFKVALGSMCFQNGVAWNTKHVRTWELMMAHKWEEAAVEAADSDWFDQTPERVFEFQAALRKLSDGQSNIADPFRKKVAEAREMAAGKQSTVKPPSTGNPDKGATTALPEGKAGIKEVQTKLKALGLYDGKIDGIATSSKGETNTTKGESNTTKGIKKFQQQHRLPATGIVDAATWDALCGKKDERSIFEKFMASVEQPKKEEAAEPKSQKGWGSEPKAETKKPKPDKGWGSEPKAKEDSFANIGNFVDPKYFVGQTVESGPYKGTKPGKASCRYASTDIAIRYLKAEMPEMAEQLGIDTIWDLQMGAGFLQILKEDKSHKSEVKGEFNESHPEWMNLNEQHQIAIAYIDEKLSQKVPVVVGVDHTFNRPDGGMPASKMGDGYNEGTTDHFITLTGIGRDEQGMKYYTYFEVATSHHEKGTDTAKNRLYETSPGKFCRKKSAPNKLDGAGSSGKQDYQLSMVLVYEPDRKRFETEIKKNNEDKVQLLGK